jgi:hypothetical protein
MGYALEREQGKEHSRWERQFFNQNVGPILSHHIVQIKVTIAD